MQVPVIFKLLTYWSNKKYQSSENQTKLKLTSGWVRCIQLLGKLFVPRSRVTKSSRMSVKALFPIIPLGKCNNPLEISVVQTKYIQSWDLEVNLLGSKSSRLFLSLIRLAIQQVVQINSLSFSIKPEYPVLWRWEHFPR